MPDGLSMSILSESPLSVDPVYWCRRGRVSGPFRVWGPNRGSVSSVAQPRRYIRTAITRLESLPVVGRSNLLKMLDTYFSTARSVTTKRSAMP